MNENIFFCLRGNFFIKSTLGVISFQKRFFNDPLKNSGGSFHRDKLDFFEENAFLKLVVHRLNRLGKMLNKTSQFHDRREILMLRN